MSDSDNLTYAQAAAILNLPAGWLRKHIKGLPHSKYGRLVRFDMDDIKAIRAMHKQAPEKTEAPALALVREAAFQNHTPRPSRQKVAA
jgi:hypothetical protein